jgi:hypothetical protein
MTNHDCLACVRAAYPTATIIPLPIDDNDLVVCFTIIGKPLPVEINRESGVITDSEEFGMGSEFV